MKHQRFFRVSLLLFGLLMFAGYGIAQSDTSLVGTWRAKADSPLVLKINADGTGALNGAGFKYEIEGNKLSVVEGAKVTTFSYMLKDSALILYREGTVQGVIFERIDEIQQSTPTRRGSGESMKAGKGLVGRWQGKDGVAQINADGTLIFGGQTFRYTAKNNILTLIGTDGALEMPYQLDGDTLVVSVNGEESVLKRLTGSGRGGVASGGANPQELVGKWCYMSNVYASNGGRMSNRCFTLYENGTYQYYAETSSSGPVASSVTQESDKGRWTATATTITSVSPKTGTNTYRLEKRNHPKTHDPMLVMDGDAYVTYGPRRPW